MNKLNLFLCPTCGQVAIAYSNPTLHCCGQQLSPVAVRPCESAPVVTPMDGEYLLQFDCPQSKDFYIAAVVVERYDRVELIRLFAEQSPEVRISQVKGSKIIILYRQQDLVWAEEYKA